MVAVLGYQPGYSSALFYGVYIDIFILKINMGILTCGRMRELHL